MGLRMKFNLVLIVCFAIGLSVAGLFTQRILQENARQEVLQNAEIMMESASAIRSYTAQDIQPLLEQQLRRQFLPHSVPSYAAQRNFATLREKFPDFTYKEAALNPTNPSDRASDWEADIINDFRNNREKTTMVVEREAASGPSLVLARRLAVTSESCLVCHSTPDRAPDTMRKLYGDQNGYNWQLNEVIGAQVVSVPMALPLQRAEATLITFMGGLSGVFLLVLILVNIMLHYVVIRPVRTMARIANDVSIGKPEVDEYEPRGRDEVATLGMAFNRMRRSMESALRLLDE